MEVLLAGGSAVVDRPISAEGEALRRRSVRRAPVAEAPRPGVILHHGDEPAARAVSEVFSGLGVQVGVVDATDARWPSSEALAFGVVCGHATFADAAVLDEELRWIREADAEGTAILGIGRGARLLALALGGEVEELEQAHRGWTMAASVIPHQIPGGPWLTWQHERLELPVSGEVLAANRLGPQVFRLGRHLGVQFHPEAVPASVGRWTRTADGVTEPGPDLAAHGHDPIATAVRRRRLFATFIESLAPVATG